MPVPRSISLSPQSRAFAVSLLLISFFSFGCASYGPKPVASSPTPGLTLSAHTLSFHTVVVGQTATQSLKVSNTGTRPLQVTAFSVSNKEFSISGPSVPRTILPANSLLYTVAFTPTATGSASATVSITTDADSAPASVSLAGSGEKAFADLVVTPASINFGNITLSKKSSQNVTLQNTGDINLTLQGVTVAGSGFGYADLSPGFSLAPNQKVIFQVWFSPRVAGPAAAKVSLLSPNLSSPATLYLTGDGVTTSSPTPTSQHTVHLTWGESSSMVLGYRVYRSEVAGGSYALLNGALVSVLTFDDATVASGTTYYYVVTAVDAAGAESVYSNQATAVIPTS